MMKKGIMILLACLFSLTAFSQGIEFQEKPYAELLKIAKKQNKLIFVDVYTSWCGPCKYMAKNIFTKEEAGAYYNENFLNLKVDAEKSEDGKMIAKQFEVTGFPTCLFIDGNGELVYRFMGGRALKQFIDEGKKALDAYKARPELKKYTRQYEKGKRDKAFLERYFLLKDRSGLNCSDVLCDYFAQLTDEEILDSVQVERLAKMTVYDAELTPRIVELAIKKAEKTDRKGFEKINKAVCTYLGTCLRDAAKSADPTAFENVLSLKERLFKVAKNHDSASKASLGGGNIYIPSDLSRLDYYSAHQHKEKFSEVYEYYFQAVRKKFEETREEKAAMRRAMDDKLKAAKESGDEKEYEAVKNMRAMMIAFSGIDDYYVASNLITKLGQYDEWHTKAKDEAYKQKITDWYLFLHAMSPSPKVAVHIADKLVELGKKEAAVEALTLALEKGEDAAGVTPADVQACQAKLDELKK